MVDVKVVDVTAKRLPAYVAALLAGDILGTCNEPQYTCGKANAVFIILKAAFIYCVRPRFSSSIINEKNTQTRTKCWRSFLSVFPFMH